MDEGSRQRTGRWKRGLLIGLVVLLILALGLLAGVYLYGPLRWERMMAQLDGPVTLDEMIAAADVIPEAENLYLELLPLHDRLMAVVEATYAQDQLLLPPLGSLEKGQTRPVTFGPERIDATRAFIADHADVFARLPAYVAGRRGRPVFVDGAALLEAYYASDALKYPSRSAAKLLGVRARLAAVDGEAAAAAADVMAQFGLAWTHHQGPTLVGGLIQSGIEGLALDTLEGVLVDVELTPNVLRELDAVLRERDDADVLVWALRGERAFILATAEAMISGRGSKVFDVQYNVFQHAAWLVKADLAHAIERMNRLLDAADGPPSALLTATRALDQAPVPRYAILSSILTPSLERAVALFIRVEATRAAARTALACERYRLDHGTWPDTLAALVPSYLAEVPLDPFDGQALRYVSGAAGITVYSIGDDGVDDGGNLEAWTTDHRRRRRPDIGFRIWRSMDR